MLLFHISGCIGMFTAKRQWFINLTPLNMLVVFAMILFSQKNKNIAFYSLVVICFLAGMLIEVFGVRTGFLFGSYEYGNVLGPKISGVPWLMGLNWFIVVYSCGMVTSLLNAKVENAYRQMNRAIPARLIFASFIMDAALIATFYDWVMEEVAVKLGYWQWLQNGEASGLNYASWFLVSALLLIVFRLLRFDKQNHFALHLLIIQLLFFGVLRTFL